jgi:hypothetical protein
MGTPAEKYEELKMLTLQFPGARNACFVACKLLCYCAFSGVRLLLKPFLQQPCRADYSRGK